MSTVVHDEPRAVGSAQRPLAGQVRLVLVALWLTVFVAIAALGERPATLADLMDAVDSGEVSSVEVAGGLEAGALGWSTQDVRWHQGLFGRHAQVLYASEGYEQEAADSNPPSASVTTTDVAILVRERDPNVRVQVSDMQRTSTTTLMRWEVPSWVFWAVLGGLVLTLWLIVDGPEPWRATRWGWAWATLLTGPVGAMAFALLSGPVTGKQPPKAHARRLTGGWSFILLVLLSSPMMRVN
jgi:hypothetical protein